VTEQIATDAELDAAGAHLEAWLQRQLEENPAAVAVERDESGERRWFLRVHGVEKDVFSIWWTLRQRTLHYETYVLPSPPEARAEVFEFLLRRNQKIYGAAFAIGDEDALYLVGQIPVSQIDDDELDRILGTLWEWTERSFRPAMRTGFGARFPN